MQRVLWLLTAVLRVASGFHRGGHGQKPVRLSKSADANYAQASNGFVCL